MAVKALLLHTNPALLVPLDRQHDISLVLLSTSADLDDPKLRTVGLSEAMSRAIAGSTATSAEALRVPVKRRNRIVACRNGSMHLGGVSALSGRHVLTDCIAMLAWVLERLQSSPQKFFGTNLDDCLALIRAGQSEDVQAVLARVSEHRRASASPLGGLPEEVVEALVQNLEADVLTMHLPGEDGVPEVAAARTRCPACERRGALYGIVGVDGDADAEWEDGEAVLHGRWGSR